MMDIARRCSAMAARMISQEPLYHALSRVFIADAIRAQARGASADGSGTDSSLLDQQ
jgi:hypothetical protein